MLIFSLLSLIILEIVFVGVDLGLSFYEWQARIHIGRWNDRVVWQNALEKRARKWIHRSPTVKLTDRNRWVLYDIFRGKYRSNTIQSWQDAGLLLGLEESDVKHYALEKLDSKSGEWKRKPIHIDSALLAYVLKNNGVLSEKAEKTIHDLLFNLKGDQKTIPYRKENPQIRFVDTIGLGVPFLAACGESELAKAQIAEYDQAKLPNSSIPSHVFDLNRKVPMGIYDWARGIGWYILGLTESNIEGVHDRRIVDLADELLSYQREDGGYGAMYFNPNSTYESSGTALIGVLMVKAFQITGDSKFINAAIKAEKRLMVATRRNGALDFCQGDTKGIGYYAHTFTLMPFAQGIALKLSKELNAYAN